LLRLARRVRLRRPIVRGIRKVEGPILRLNVRDSQFVKQVDLLFEIGDGPYRYALERAISEQTTLEGQIVDERRRIAAQVSAVSVAEAHIQAATGVYVSSKPNLRFSGVVDSFGFGVTPDAGVVGRLEPVGLRELTRNLSWVVVVRGR